LGDIGKKMGKKLNHWVLEHCLYQSDLKAQGVNPD